MSKVATNGDIVLTAQDKLNSFLKDNSLTIVVYVLTPKTKTPVPIVEYIPDNLDVVIVAVEKNEQQIPTPA